MSIYIFSAGNSEEKQQLLQLSYVTIKLSRARIAKSIQSPQSKLERQTLCKAGFEYKTYSHW